jgi:hypothetical protein
MCEEQVMNRKNIWNLFKKMSPITLLISCYSSHGVLGLVSGYLC